MLGGGLLPGTLTVVYGATGIGKTHLGLTFAHHGRAADGAPGLVVDMNARGDSQQHAPYAERLYGWPIRRWTHTVLPMADPYPPAAELEAHYLDAFPWVGRRSDYEVATPEGREFDWGWKAAYARALYTARPFFYFHFANGSRRVVVDGIEPRESDDSIQAYIVDDLYRKIIHRDAETLGMEICLPVWQHRAFIDAPPLRPRVRSRRSSWSRPRRPGSRTSSRARWRRATSGRWPTRCSSWGARRSGSAWAASSAVAKHRGSAMSDEIRSTASGSRGSSSADGGADG